MFKKEMACSPYCFLAVGFIIATLSTCCLSNKNIQDFYANLNSNQKRIKDEINLERLKIYITGILFGCVNATLFYMFINKNGKAKLCLLLSIILATSYFYYILTPKSKYMVSYLEDKEQISKWLKIYKQMQYNYHLGFLLGMSSIISLSAYYC